MKVFALILGAGKGERLGFQLPKAFVPLRGKPLFVHSVLAFEEVKEIQGGAIVVPEGWEGEAEKHLISLKKRWKVTKGGKTRQESAFFGLLALEDLRPDYVLIHDAARPLLKPALVERMLGFAPQATVLALKAIETLVEGEGEFAKRALEREKVWVLQTPQGFPYQGILHAHKEARQKGLEGSTDDVSLYINFGGNVRLVKGDPTNIKVTFPHDLKLAEEVLLDVELYAL